MFSTRIGIKIGPFTLGMKRLVHQAVAMGSTRSASYWTFLRSAGEGGHRGLEPGISKDREYRGGFPGTFDDVRAGVGLLEKISKDPALDMRRVVATGHSAGGQLVLWLAKQKARRCEEWFPLAPVADLRKAWELRLSANAAGELLGGSPAQVPQRYRETSPIEMVPMGVRARVIHGDRDDVVPLSLSVAYVEAARKNGDDCTLTEPASAGHFELIDPRTVAWAQVRDTIEKLL